MEVCTTVDALSKLLSQAEPRAVSSGKTSNIYSNNAFTPLMYNKSPSP